MRILTVGNLYPPQHLGGYERMWQAAVAGLRARGHDVRVLTTDTRMCDEEDDEPGIERTLRWYWRDHRFPYMGPLAVRGLERHNRATFLRAAEDAELVSWWSMGGMSLRLLGLATVPALSVVHDDWLVYGPRVDRSLQRRPKRVPPAEALGHGLFVSEHTLERARAAGWAPPTAEVVHSGYDERVFEPAEPRPWRWRLLLPGRIDARKGHRTAVAALRELPEEATLTVAGAGDARLAGELEREPRVRMAGPLRPAALAAAYAAADVVLFPAEWEEPWGLVPLEAMAVGRPVVATGTGGSGEYLRAGRNCLLHAPGDPAALAAAVRRLAEDEALRARLREGGFATARRHTLSGFVERVCDAHETYASRG
ncbi:MAG TPA: glycosyltransferase family 4 protein [Solirubrobacteraceae bacterium]|nr:glycosyltransferase family 4 protein [Solirubrobacteraceae bacterium]